MKLSIILVLVVFICQRIVTENVTNQRRGRIISLFNIVQFPNAACSTGSSSFSNGSSLTFMVSLPSIVYFLGLVTLLLNALVLVDLLVEVVVQDLESVVFVGCVHICLFKLIFLFSVMVSSTATTISQNCTYLVNPGFPR